ncbi:MAG TPA: hypothetical protein VGY90_01170 [Steroidobacteraceae bacterium]|nr:hypothetical protein [Steroidobacteraceae bacterium]
MGGITPRALEDSVRARRLTRAFRRPLNFTVLDVSMQSFVSVFPQLAFVLASELRATGRADIARELEASTVKAVKFDSNVNVGSVVLEPPRKLNSVERNVIGQKLGQVIPFSRPHYASLQLDNFGRVIGVELVAPPPGLASALRLTSNNRWSGP